MASKRNNTGFTLIEIIAVLVLLGIIGVFGSMFLVNMVRSYQWAEDNAHLAQKAQITLTRIAVEMSYADRDSIDLNNDTIDYEVIYPEEGPPAVTVSIWRDGDILIFTRDGDDFPLTDRVEDFEVNLPPGGTSGYFTLILTMTGANGIQKQFTKSIAFPRNG